MELWIRSQDKEMLKKINNIEIDFLDFKKYSYTKDIKSKGEYSIRGNGETIGQYKTKERALEVLDEIQNLLQPKIKYIQEEPMESIVDFGYQITQKVDMKIQEINRIVYVMPKE